jgi:hypothetical protein
MTIRTLLVACALVAAAACSSDKRAPAQPEEKPAAAAPAPVAVEEGAHWAPPTPAVPLTLMVTGDNWGEIAPCG